MRNEFPTESAEQIRADIERTRERLGDTVEALGAQLNPSVLKERVKESVHEATIGRVQHMARNAKTKTLESGRNFIDTIRDNPIPAAMIAGGIGWLLLNKKRDSGVGAGARSVAEHVSSGTHAVTDSVAAGASSVAHTVADRARAGGHRVDEAIDDNPMMLGAVAAAVGLAVGMSLPVSRKESELMGGKRDDLVDKARETISDTKEKVRTVAERTVSEMGHTLKTAAKEEGLSL